MTRNSYLKNGCGNENKKKEILYRRNFLAELSPHCHKNDKCTETLMYTMVPFNKPSRVSIEEDEGPLLPNFKRQMLGTVSDEQVLATNPRYTHFYSNEKRINIKDVILNRHYYNGVGDIYHLQVLLPLHVKNVLVKSLHGKTRKHPCVSNTMQEIRQKNTFCPLGTKSALG